MKNLRGCSRAVSWRRANWCGRKSSWPPTRGFRTRGSPGRFRSAVRRSIGPSAALSKATSTAPSATSRVREPNASSRPRRRPFWRRLPARRRLRDAPAGRSNSWPMRWSNSPIMMISRARRCDEGWRRTNSNPGVGPCGAFPRSMASTSRAWRMCWISMRSRRIRCGR